MVKDGNRLGNKIKMKKIWFCLGLIFGLSRIVSADTAEIPLYKLAAVKSVDLRCITSEHSVSIGIPERWEIKKVLVVFKYVNSALLSGDLSALTVKINGYPVAQIKLNPIVPEGVAKVAIPPLLLDAGYNDLTFTVVQHGNQENGCEDPCAPELWTIIKLDEAFIHCEYDLKPVPLRLSAIPDFIFDPKIVPCGKVNIIADGITSEEMLNVAGIVASGVALRYDYKKVLFSMSQDIKPNFDNILIGKKEFVGKFLGEKGIAINENEGPLLKITHLPQRGAATDPFHSLIIITGTDLDQVKLSAETFAILSIPLPDTDELVPIKFELPDVSQYSGKFVLMANKKYAFKMLNMDTRTFKGLNPGPADITFRLPPDFLIKQNQSAMLSLSFAYGAGMRDNSVLNILLNGKSVQAVRLNSTYGAVVEGYNIAIPTHLFRAGMNVLTFAPKLIPTMNNNCEPIPTDTLFFTLFENSTFLFPPMPHFVEMPNMELFFLNGFPFTRWPDGHETLLYLTQPTSHTIVSAFDLIGSITQKNGFPLLGIKMTTHKSEKWDGDLIVLGSINTIPENLRDLAPLKLSEKTSIPFPIVRSWKGEKSLAYSTQVSQFGKEKGIIMEFQSPYNLGRAVVLLSAFSPKELLELCEGLLEPALETKCKGDLSLVDLTTSPDYKVFTFEVAEKYFSGKGGKMSRIKATLYSLNKIYLFVLIGVILILGLAIFYLLIRWRKKRLKNEKETETTGI